MSSSTMSRTTYDGGKRRNKTQKRRKGGKKGPYGRRTTIYRRGNRPRMMAIH